MSVTAHLARFERLLDDLIGFDRADTPAALDGMRRVFLALGTAAIDAAECVDNDTPPELARRAERAVQALRELLAAGMAARAIEDAGRRQD